MQILVKIDDKLYNRIKYLEPKSNTMLDELMRSIQNGFPLPKGHGRLIDADVLWDLYHSNDYDFYEALDSAPTIIDAERSEEE